MEISQAIRTRRSIRSFKPDPVSRKVLEEILETSKWAPSASNTQPWEFAILGGKVIEELKTRLIKKTEVGWDISTLKFSNMNPDIPQPELPELYQQRAIQVRAHIDAYQFPRGTENLEEKRAGYLLHSARFYGAPNAIILYTERAICPKAIFDIGIMTQTIALATLPYELGTCIAGMAVFWPEILREMLGIPESKLIVTAIAIGYPDYEARVNNFARTREPLDAFAYWHGV